MRLTSTLATLAATGLLTAGCTHYFIGTTLPANLRTIAVPTFANRAAEPEVEATVTRATLQEFQRDGTLSLTTAESADIVLAGSVVSYSLEPVRYSRDNPLATAEYRLVLRSEITATERTTGKTIYNGVVEGDTLFRATGDLTTAKRTALTPAARDLAHEIVNAVISAW